MTTTEIPLVQHDYRGDSIRSNMKCALINIENLLFCLQTLVSHPFVIRVVPTIDVPKSRSSLQRVLFLIHVTRK